MNNSSLARNLWKIICSNNKSIKILTQTDKSTNETFYTLMIGERSYGYNNIEALEEDEAKVEMIFELLDGNNPIRNLMFEAEHHEIWYRDFNSELADFWLKVAYWLQSKL